MALPRAWRFKFLQQWTGKACFQPAESKHTAIPAHTGVYTGKPKQEKRKEVVGIQEEGQDYSQEKKKNQGGLLGGGRVTNLHSGFVVWND